MVIFILMPILIGILTILLYALTEFLIYLFDSAFIELDSLSVLKIKERLKKCSH